jgi:hypothetical protein
VDVNRREQTTTPKHPQPKTGSTPYRPTVDDTPAAAAARMQLTPNSEEKKKSTLQH